MSLFPLPALIFLSSLLVLLIVLAIVYLLLRKNLLCPINGGTGGEEEGQPLLEETTVPSNPSATVEPSIDMTDTSQNQEETTGNAEKEENPLKDAINQYLANRKTVRAFEDILPQTPMTSAFPSSSPRQTPSLTPRSQENNQTSTDAREVEEPPLCVAGKVLIQFTYMPAANKVNLTVIRVQDMPEVERGGSDMIAIHLCVLPIRKQRQRTKPIAVSKGVFNETFSFIHMTKDKIETCGIRLRVYGTQRFSRRLIGEVKLPLAQLDLVSPLSDEQVWKYLRPKGLVTEDEFTEPIKKIESSESVLTYEEPINMPELMVNLHYKDLTGRLYVEIIKGANFKTSTMVVNPSVFIKVKCVAGDGKQIGKSKTIIHPPASDPEFNETFVYPMSTIDLKEATMMFTVLDARKKKRGEIIGWFAFGKNTSGTNESLHWNEMVKNPDSDACRWQMLLMP
ncbi:synaptotagmin-14 [Hydra vulgaris]|uniref:Synaptotagmin-14 n=1 Tax=Hydra vulgaris TaxID=6087 RepID=A0ABM4CKC2_HYDVU